MGRGSAGGGRCGDGDCRPMQSGKWGNMIELVTDYELFYHRLSFAGTKSKKWRDGILN